MTVSEHAAAAGITGLVTWIGVRWHLRGHADPTPRALAWAGVVLLAVVLPALLLT